MTFSTNYATIAPMGCGSEFSTKKPFKNRIGILHDTGCFIFAGTYTDKGCRVSHKKKQHLAHRLAYILHYQIELEPEDVITHTCNRINCVNPEHLQLKKQKTYHLTKTQKDEIKQKLSVFTEVTELAKEYNVPVSVIERIYN